MRSMSSTQMAYLSPRATDRVQQQVKPTSPSQSSLFFIQLPEYIGHDLYDPIWHELDKRQAVVFLHGSQTPSSTPYPHPFLGVPITEVPNETYKAAAHLVVSGRKRLYPNVKIILAHMGGTLPSMAARTAALSSYMGCTLSPEEILEDFKSFYFDTALSAYAPAMEAMERWVGEERLVYGSDFPGEFVQLGVQARRRVSDVPVGIAVSVETVKWFNSNLGEYCNGEWDPKQEQTDEPREKLHNILYHNALHLFPRLTSILSKQGRAK